MKGGKEWRLRLKTVVKRYYPGHYAADAYSPHILFYPIESATKNSISLSYAKR